MRSSAQAAGPDISAAEAVVVPAKGKGIVEGGNMAARLCLAKFFVPCTDQLLRYLKKAGIEFADRHIRCLESEVGTLERALHELPCSTRPHVSQQCPREEERPRSFVDTRYGAPSPQALDSQAYRGAFQSTSGPNGSPCVWGLMGMSSAASGRTVGHLQ